jgi:hypothetical protein
MTDQNRKKLRHYNTFGHVMLRNTRRGVHEVTFSRNCRRKYLLEQNVCEITLEELENARRIFNNTIEKEAFLWQ